MEKIKPESAVLLLQEEGISVTYEEAEQILSLIYSLAEIAITQILQDENC